MCRVVSFCSAIIFKLSQCVEKSHGISPSCGIYGLSLLIDMIFTLYFEVSPGISWDPTRWVEVFLEGVRLGLPFSNPMRVSLHFSSSHGIQLDMSRPHPLHEKFSPSRGIPRDGEKFSWMGWDMGSEQDRTRLGSTSSLKRDGGWVLSNTTHLIIS